MNEQSTNDKPQSGADVVLQRHVRPRFRVEKRIGIVAVYDLQHPQYDPDRQGCHSDLPWVVAAWSGYNDPKEGWCLYDFQELKAQELCSMLNAASWPNAELSEPGGPVASESTNRVAPPGFAPASGSGTGRK